MPQLILDGHSFRCIAFGTLMGTMLTGAAAYGYIAAIPLDTPEAHLIARCMSSPDSFVEIKLADGSRCSYAPSEKLLTLILGSKAPIIKGR